MGNMKWKRSNVGFWFITGLLILISAFCITLTVKGQVKDEKIYEYSFQQLEQGYLKEMRNYLKESGYEDSGINLSRIVDEKGDKTYKVTIHHKRFSKLNEEEKELIKKELDSFTYLAESTVICHEFFLTY